MVDYNFSSDTSTNSTAWASSLLFISYTAASVPDMCSMQTWSKPLYSSISCFVTFVKHFPIILITSPTPIGLTSPLSSGIRWLARTGSMAVGSMYSAHNQQIRAAKASHKLEPDFLNDLLARVLWKPFVSTTLVIASGEGGGGKYVIFMGYCLCPKSSGQGCTFGDLQHL